jgi:peptide/bleomycin uptake transporter
MFRAFFRSPKWRYRAYGGSGAILILLLVQLKVALTINELNKRFYDVWADPGRHYLAEAYAAILPFLWTGVTLVLVSTIASYVTSKFVLWWREAVTFHYLDLARTSQAQLEGSSQRMQEDVARFTKVMETIALTVVGSMFTLIGFVPILWALSNAVQMPLLAAIPGSLVWVCFLTGMGGFLISWLVGSKLTVLEYENQVVEAAFRKELVYCEDDPHLYAEQQQFQDLFGSIRTNLNRLYFYNALFDLWKHFYLIHVWMVPFLVLASGLFMGLITFGVMMQVNDAFTRVNNTVSQFIQNWQIITEVRSIYWRLGEFEQQLTAPQHGTEAWKKKKAIDDLP